MMIAMNQHEDEEATEDQRVHCGQEDGTIEDEDFNWKAQMRPARNTCQPTLKERGEHESLHMSYRV